MLSGTKATKENIKAALDRIAAQAKALERDVTAPDRDRLDLLARESVLVHPGYFFDFDHEAFLVLSLLPPPDAFAEASKYAR